MLIVLWLEDVDSVTIGARFGLELVTKATVAKAVAGSVGYAIRDVAIMKGVGAIEIGAKAAKAINAAWKVASCFFTYVSVLFKSIFAF